MARRQVMLSSGIALALAVAVSCQEPTQVTVEARTNVIYRSGITTAFTVGAAGQTESADPTTESVDPWGGDGLIGTLSVVPASSDEAALSIKLVMGVTSGTRTCVPPAYRGCIVARRTLRYVAGMATRLPITLYAECVDVPCDEGSTCNALRQCVPAAVDQASCEAGACRLPGETDGGSGGGGQDGSAPDASFIDGSGDGGRTDASDTPIEDASADRDVIDSGEGDASEDGGTDSGSVRGEDASVVTKPSAVACGGTICNAPEFCCIAPTTFATCMSDETTCYMTGGQPNKCDGSEDCDGGVCCGVNGTLCATKCTPYPQICASDGLCSEGVCTDSNADLFLGQYRTCIK